VFDAPQAVELQPRDAPRPDAHPSAVARRAGRGRRSRRAARTLDAPEHGGPSAYRRSANA